MGSCASRPSLDAPVQHVIHAAPDAQIAASSRVVKSATKPVNERPDVQQDMQDTSLALRRKPQPGLFTTPEGGSGVMAKVRTLFGSVLMVHMICGAVGLPFHHTPLPLLATLVRLCISKLSTFSYKQHAMRRLGASVTSCYF